MIVNPSIVKNLYFFFIVSQLIVQRLDNKLINLDLNQVLFRWFTSNPECDNNVKPQSKQYFVLNRRVRKPQDRHSNDAE